MKTPVPVISADMTNGKANIFPRIGDICRPAKKPKKVTNNPNKAANIYTFILSLVYRLGLGVSSNIPTWDALFLQIIARLDSLPYSVDQNDRRSPPSCKHLIDKPGHRFISPLRAPVIFIQ